MCKLHSVYALHFVNDDEVATLVGEEYLKWGHLHLLKKIFRDLLPSNHVFCAFNDKRVINVRCARITRSNK